FGVIKHHFQILLLPPEYPIEIQALIPVTLCVIHNLIMLHEQDPDADGEMQEGDSGGDGGTEEVGDIEQEETRALCNPIAEAMWHDYQDYLQKQGQTRSLIVLHTLISLYK
ncbi:hypothetical protein M404DRAFT_168096, partial [Pisolithus tinctorius Marx 270]